MSRFRYLLAAAFLTLLVWPGAAAATHNNDQHSPNMDLLWSLPEGPTRTHSDIAIWGNIGVAGNYDGFRIFNVTTGALIVNFPCRGPQNDVSLWEHNGRLLLFMSVDSPQTNGRLYCSPVRTSDTTACGPNCFEGIRIFDITPATDSPAREQPLLHQGRVHGLRVTHAYARPRSRRQPCAALHLVRSRQLRAELPGPAQQDFDRRGAAECA